MKRGERQPLLPSDNDSVSSTKYVIAEDTKNAKIDNDVPNYIPKCPITVEPFMIFYFYAVFGFSSLLTQYLYKRLGEENNLQPSSSNISHCDQNKSDPRYLAQQKAQSEASEWLIYFSITTTIPSMLVTVFYGSYSDKAGRKICLILPCLGSLLRQGGTLAVIFFDWPLYCLFPAYFIEGICGYFTTAYMGCFSYIADVSTTKNKAIRIVIGEACSIFAAATSEIVTGYLITLFPDFIVPAAVSTGCLLVALLYTIFVIPELVEKDPNAKLLDCNNLLQVLRLFFRIPEKQNRVETSSQSITSKSVHSDTEWLEEDVLILPAQETTHSHLTNDLRREVEDRAKICGNNLLHGKDISPATVPTRVFKLRMLIIILFFVVLPMMNSGVDTLYVLNLPFCWSSEKIGWYNAIRIALIQISSFLAVLLMRKVCNLSEITITMVALISYSLSKTYFAFAQYDYMMYVGSGIGALSVLSIPMLRTAMSQEVTHHEQGTLFASISLAESACSLAGNTILNSIYAATVGWYRGFVYLIMAGLTLWTLVLLGIYQFKTRKRKVINVKPTNTTVN